MTARKKTEMRNTWLRGNYLIFCQRGMGGGERGWEGRRKGRRGKEGSGGGC